MTADLPSRHGTLLVVGDTHHASDSAGRIATHTALARQLDQWFDQFDTVQIAAVMVPGEPPTGYEPYDRQPDDFIPLRSAGGSGLRAKLDSVRASMSWARTLIPLLRRADVVHLRAPCNVTLIAIPLARLLSPRRYAIYAGAWDPPPGGPLSYRVQRRMLRHFGGVVHVYAPPSDRLGPNLRPNFSPTFTRTLLDELGTATERRLDRIRTNPPTTKPLRIACIGRFSTNKNQALVVRAAALLRSAGVEVEVRFAGTGGTETDIRSLVDELGLRGDVTFLGQCDEATLMAQYEWADVNVAPTFVEGFGRVIVEGMAVGCPAICGPGAVQREMVDGGRGRQVDPGQPLDLVRVLEDLRRWPPATWECTAKACRDYAATVTIDAFQVEVRQVIESLERDIP